jgi:protein-arginine deiminase
MTFHHNLAADTVYATRVPRDADSTAFITAMTSAVSSSMVPRPLSVLNYDDQWTQDNFEPAYMSMPNATGQHVIRVNYRSANLFNPFSTSRPLRPAGVVVFEMRGPDVAAIQEWTTNADSDMDSLNSMGNTETIPPYEYNGKSYPLGRLFRGSIPTFFPDAKFSKMLESQGVQPHVYVDTSWLVVGHVDETITFLKANTPRGWVLLANDARLARTMLEDLVAAGQGSTKMFVGKKWVNDFGNEYSAEVTVSQVLADATVMAESASSAAEVDAQLDIIIQETGLTPSEIIRVPFLHDSYGGYSVAYQPGTINSLVLNDKFVVAPDPFGPVVNGQDVFKTQLSDALAPLGYTVRYVDNWNLYHRLLGEVHCGSNTARVIPDVKWWETGR